MKYFILLHIKSLLMDLKMFFSFFFEISDFVSESKVKMKTYFAEFPELNSFSHPPISSPIPLEW